MSTITVLDFPTVSTYEGTDYIYAIRGTGVDRDKKILASNLLQNLANKVVGGTTDNILIQTVTGDLADGGKALSDYLAKDNTTTYNPTLDYHPATKKYTDDAIAAPGFLKADGSIALTADWDVGAGNDIITDVIQARPSGSLVLNDEGGSAAISVDVSGDVLIANNVVITGDATINGTTTTINTQNLDVEDKNIVIGNVTTPTDVTADGGGITLKGATDKTITWTNSNDRWRFNQGIQITQAASGATPNIVADNFIIEGNTSTGLSILTTDGNSGFIMFGTASDPTSAIIQYDDNNNVMEIGTAAAGDDLSLRSGNDVESVRIDSKGNIGISTSIFGTNAEKVLSISNGVEPTTSPANQITVYSKDSSVGAANATVGLRTEQAVEAIGTFTASHKLRIWINGTEYWMQLDAV